MHDNFFIQLEEELTKLGQDPSLFVGCTLEQIEKIKSKQRVSSLPHLYLEFLGTFGVKAGDFFAGSEIFCGDLISYDFKEEAENILQKRSLDSRLPQSAFVFLCHQNYIFMYFLTDAHENDPHVYRYIDGDESPKSIGLLSQLFLEELGLFKKLKKPNKH